MHKYSLIYLCWGMYNRCVIGVIFFNPDGTFNNCMFDYDVAKSILRVISKKKKVPMSLLKMSTSAIEADQGKIINEEYWVKKFVPYSNGLVQSEKPSQFSKENPDLEFFEKFFETMK